MAVTMIDVRVRNGSPGKIADWVGWQGKATVRDEFGNKFLPIDLRNRA
jgi:hypothetical protein